jgi:hypothetical protein
MSRKEKAIQLRKEGYSYSHIAKMTGYSLSTLSYHLRDISYTPNKETVLKIGKAISASSKRKSEQKQASIERARTKARQDIGPLTKRDLFMLGLGIYIGEGSKTQDIIRLVNADPNVLKIYISWLQSFGLGVENFVIRIHLYPDSSVLDAEVFWSKQLGLPRTQFQKPSIDRRVGKDRKRSGTHKYGTAHVTVRSNGEKAFGVELARRIGAWMEEVLKYGAKK